MNKNKESKFIINTLGMKSDSRQKNSQAKVKSQLNNFITYASNTLTEQNITHTVQQQQCFHLHDQQPQSMNAKRKLQQFSISLNKYEQKPVHPHQHAKHTLHLLKKKTIEHSDVSQHQQNHHGNIDVGWTDTDINISLQHEKVMDRRKSVVPHINRTFYSTRNSLNKTVHVNAKSKHQKRQSLTSNLSPDTKLNLTFNNLISTDIQMIKQQDISKEILNKIKNSQPKRPTTTSYYAASQKILTLFQKEVKQGKMIGETMRIHSIKDPQLKTNNNPLTFKGRQKILKTCSINSFYINDKNKLPHEKIQNLSKNSTVNERKMTERYGTGKKELVNKNVHHYRTYSEPIESECKKGKGQSNEGMALSHRKYRIMADKKAKKSQGVDKELQETNNACDKFNIRYQNQNQSQRNNAQQQKQNLSIKQTSNYQSKPIPKASHLSSQSILASNSLQQDFTRLINLLKDESRYTFGSQLHSYLAQVNNAHQCNYYMSKAVNKKHSSRNSLNQSIKMQRSKRSKFSINHQHSTNQLYTTKSNNEDTISPNNTTRHYVPFSASKQRSKTNNFLISTAQLI